MWVPTRAALAFARACEALCRASGGALPPVLTRAEVAKVGVTHYFSIDKAARVLGYAPGVSSRDAMRATARRFAARRGERVEPPALGWWLAVVGGMLLLWAAAFSRLGERDAGAGAADAVVRAARALGVRLFASRANLRVVFWAAVAAHAVEALVAARIARAHGVPAAAWAAQTFLLGGPSLFALRAALAAARAAEAVQYEKIIKLQDELEEKGGPSSTTIGILNALYREFNAIDDIDSAQEVYDQLVLLTKELRAPLAERNLLPTSMMHK